MASRAEEPVVHSHSLDDDADSVMEPPLDEFDMWDHYQAEAATDCPLKREAVSQLQKSFLDQLHSEVDINAAAAKALLHLKAKASLEASLRSLETAEGPEGSPTTSESAAWSPAATPGHVKICDDDERSVDRDMDEFDLLAQRGEAFDSLPDDRKRAISVLQSSFLDALDREDVNGAAALALKQLLAKQPAEDSERSTDPFIFQSCPEEMSKPGEASFAELVSSDVAASDASKREALKAWSLSLQKEAERAEDVTGAVAAALLRIASQHR